MLLLSFMIIRVPLIFTFTFTLLLLFMSTEEFDANESDTSSSKHTNSFSDNDESTGPSFKMQPLPNDWKKVKTKPEKEEGPALLPVQSGVQL